MAENNENKANESTQIFRQKVLDRISSPEQLTDYLKVTSPGIWIILSAVIILLLGLVSWACIGTIRSNSVVMIVVNNNHATVITTDGEAIAPGMLVDTLSIDFPIASVDNDEYGRTIGIAEVNLPDGTYDGIVTTEEFHPIEFLFQGK